VAKQAAWLILLSLIGVSACTPVQTTGGGAIGVERRQYMLVSEQQVEQSASIAYQQELQKARSKGALNANAAQLDRVRKISYRLIPQTGVFRPDAPKWPWEVNLENTNELNAFCMPGGKIMVYSGLIDQLKLTDAELATVIGHEMAHALREHSRERVSRAMGQEAILSLGAVALGVNSQGALDLANQIATVTFQLPHSREQESEADRIGLELMARAGFDPRAAVVVWQKMSAAAPSGPSLLSTHPSSNERMADLQGLMPRVLPLYEAAHKS
jgi:Zn-dependent protease with chaperone function